MRKYFVALLLAGCSFGNALAQAQIAGEGEEHARKIVAALPSGNSLRKLVDGGRFGDGVERPWHVQMRQFKIRAAKVEVHMIWFFGPRRLKAVRVVYYNTYDGHEQITDPAMLEDIRSSGLERQIRNEATRIAPNGHWIDLPGPMFWPFSAVAVVTLWNDPWLPATPDFFTTFGPGRPALVAAVGFGDLADVDRLLASGKLGRTAINDALWYACGDPAILQQLVKAGADINQVKTGELGTCLMSAIWDDAEDAVKVLLASGARVNGPQGEYNETPLTLAASMGYRCVGIVKVLLDAGADVKATNLYGLTATMKAAGKLPEPSAVVQLLIDYGADVKAKTHDGRTALAFAAERGNVEAVQTLLAAHADVNTRDARGRTALDVASTKQVANLLIAAGGEK
jgi:ankyrin repeat protein